MNLKCFFLVEVRLILGVILGWLDELAQSQTCC